MLNLAIGRAAAGEPTGDVLADFCWGLRRHFRIEEQRLFAAFVEAGGPEPPTRVMASEHRDIERQLTQLETDSAPSEAALKYLQHALSHHCFKEEGVVYPMLDVSLGTQRMGLVEAVFREIGWEALNR